MKKLMIQEKILSSKSDSAIRRINCNTIDNWSKELENMRKQYLTTIREKYQDVKYSLEKLGANVRSTEQIKNLDVKYFREHIIDIENKFSGLKEFMKREFSILQKNEKYLDQEINNQISIRHNTTTNDLMSKSLKNNQKYYRTENEHTGRFQDFIYQTGGHYGGWGEEEHKMFMKCWQNCQSSCKIKLSAESYDGFHQFEKVLVNKVHTVLPDFSTEEIISHKNWLIQYNCLKELQTKEIAAWKAVRELDKYKKKVSNENSYKNNIKKSDTTKQEISRKDIEDWRTITQEKRKADEEIKAETYIIKRASEYDFQKKINDHDREIITKWATTRKSEIDSQRLDKMTALFKEKEKRSAEANHKIKQFRLRDNLFSKSRMTYIKSIHSTKKGMPKITERKKTDQNKYVSRCRQYDQPTEQWCRRIAKCVMTNNAASEISPSSVETIQKLGIPIWREGLLIR